MSVQSKDCCTGKEVVSRTNEYESEKGNGQPEPMDVFGCPRHENKNRSSLNGRARILSRRYSAREMDSTKSRRDHYRRRNGLFEFHLHGMVSRPKLILVLLGTIFAQSFAARILRVNGCSLSDFDGDYVEHRSNTLFMKQGGTFQDKIEYDGRGWQLSSSKHVFPQIYFSVECQRMQLKRREACDPPHTGWLKKSFGTKDVVKDSLTVHVIEMPDDSGRRRGSDNLPWILHPSVTSPGTRHRRSRSKRIRQQASPMTSSVQEKTNASRKHSMARDGSLDNMRDRGQAMDAQFGRGRNERGSPHSRSCREMDLLEGANVRVLDSATLEKVKEAMAIEEMTVNFSRDRPDPRKRNFQRSCNDFGQSLRDAQREGSRCSYGSEYPQSTTASERPDELQECEAATVSESSENKDQIQEAIEYLMRGTRSGTRDEALFYFNRYRMQCGKYDSDDRAILNDYYLTESEAAQQILTLIDGDTDIDAKRPPIAPSEMVNIIRQFGVAKPGLFYLDQEERRRYYKKWDHHPRQGNDSLDWYHPKNQRKGQENHPTHMLMGGKSSDEMREEMRAMGCLSSDEIEEAIAAQAQYEEERARLRAKEEADLRKSQGPK